MKVGLLTSGGDCQGLNAALRAVAMSLYTAVPDVKLYGIQGGYLGLIEGAWRPMKADDFSGILKLGGTILGTSRQPFKTMRLSDQNNPDKLSRMLANCKKGGFDALVILGGNGTHKTAHLLSQNGVNVVTLPKTIDNDIYGTDITFGLDSAVQRASEVIDAIHTTAASHGRVFVVEVMGHKVGWLALYAGIAGGADVILLPEIPYDAGRVADVINRRAEQGRGFSIVVAAEGALSAEAAALSKKQRKEYTDGTSAGVRVARDIGELLGQEVRVTVPGHFQRGGDPSPYDRVLCSRLGSVAGQLVAAGQFGVMTAVLDGKIVPVPLSEVAGKLKTVPPDHEIISQARTMGIAFG